MSLVRTLIAHCDWPDCDETQELSPGSTQPWRDLSEQGWKIDHEQAEEIGTYCPTHNPDDYIHLLTGTGEIGLTGCGKKIDQESIEWIEYTTKRDEVTCARCPGGN